MRLLAIFLVLTLICALAAEAQMERGTKAEGLEDVILVGAYDWQSSIASTPLTVDDNGTVVKPLLILPKDVLAGDRLGWIEQRDLDRHGIIPLLNGMQTANISAVVLNGDGDLAKNFVKTANKESLKTYVTVSMEPAEDLEFELIDIEDIASEENSAQAAKDFFFEEIGLRDMDLSSGNGDISYKLDPDFQETMFSVSLAGTKGSFLCSVNPEARDELYNQVEHLIEDYEVDGVILYNFGFQNENFCICDICKDEFYKDTGMDLSRIYSSSYNFQLWKEWREKKNLEIVREVKNITLDYDSVELGVTLGDPFDRSQGYDYVQISELADMVIIDPLPVSRAQLAAGMTKAPVYVRLSNDYVEYTISTQNVEGTVDYIEELVQSGVTGLAFEYDVVHTPLWSELEPPTKSAKWLLDRLDGKTLGIGDVSWNCDSRMEADNCYQLAEMIASRWEKSPGAVLVGDNYSAGLIAASLASYLNWPVLFTGEDLPNETASALGKLGSKSVVIFSPISDEAKSQLNEMQITIIDGSRELLLEEMKERGENLTYVILTNSHDLSLLQPKPTTEIKRVYIDDIFVKLEISPCEIPAESAGEIVRLNITLVNDDIETVEDLNLTDIFPNGKFVRYWKSSRGTVNIIDPLTGGISDPLNSFFDGSLLTWTIDRLGPGESATLTLEIEILYAMDAGWTQPIDSGITISHMDLEENITYSMKEEWPITDINYPSQMPVGIADISWKVAKTPLYTTINYYSPDDEMFVHTITDCVPDKVYSANVTLTEPGTWTFNIEAGNGFTHVTGNHTIEVTSSVPPVNVSAFSFTKIPRLSLTSAQLAAARGALIVDVAKDPQEVDSSEVEEDLQALAEELDISPKYLAIVGGPGAIPFPSTGMSQSMTDIMRYDMYREYQLQLDTDDYQEVATGRIIGLSVYDASQLVARTVAYDKIEGEWKNRSLTISSPTDYPSGWPWSPIPIRIGEYLSEAGLDVENLRWEDATYQRVTSRMNNGQNIAHFNYHGNEWAWALSFWSLMDATLDETQVKQLTLAPQTTTTNSCLTSRLKGISINVGSTDMYLPMRMDNSMALAFLRAGSVNYVGSNVLTWIFISGDYANRFYQALVFEGATVGESLMEADNLYIMKAKATERINIEKMDENLPPWENSVERMLNETVHEHMLFGDPAFRPYLPKTPELPYETNIATETDEVEVTITPTSPEGTDWLSWIETASTDGELMLNAPPALIGQLMLPADAEEITVLENGRVVWHAEDTIGAQTRVMWPVVSPALEETRTFSVEYELVPGQVQVIEIGAGWNPFSIYLEPTDSSVESNLNRKPYRTIFTVEENEWDYSFEDIGDSSITEFEPGVGYVIDSSDSFTLEIPGKPVDLPYRIKLDTGWNLIGVPLNETVPMNNITVSANHKRYTYPEAVEEGIISAFLWRYNNGEEWTYLTNDGSMVPGVAYMVETMNECRLEFN